jgi:polyisoprenoid-binding protein YceI
VYPGFAALFVQTADAMLKPMKLALPLLVATLTLASVACDNDPAKGKAQATVGAPATAPQALGAQGATSATYAFSQDGSSVDFVGAKVTRKHDGKFGTFKGTIQLVDDDATKSSVSAEIDTASLSADDPKLTGHLKSPDFFDVEKFPKARFTSTSVKTGDKGTTHTVTGNLELHGVTKQISFPANVRTGPDGVHVDAEFAIRRKDFGIVYPGMPDDLIKDDVLLKLKIEAKKQDVKKT